MGLEDFPVQKHTVIDHLFNHHLDVLRRKFPQFRSTTFWIAPECQTGNDSTMLARSALRHAQTVEMHRGKILIVDDDKTNTGLRTGGPNPLLTKHRMRKEAALVIKGKRLRFHTNMVCVCNVDKDITAPMVIKRFVDQLQRYMGEIHRPADPEKSATIKWHGKHGGALDDLAMAFQLNLVANHLVINYPRKYGAIVY